VLVPAAPEPFPPEPFPDAPEGELPAVPLVTGLRPPLLVQATTPRTSARDVRVMTRRVLECMLAPGGGIVDFRRSIGS
jgi:hypothetical protein